MRHAFSAHETIGKQKQYSFEVGGVRISKSTIVLLAVCLIGWSFLKSSASGEMSASQKEPAKFGQKGEVQIELIPGSLELGTAEQSSKALLILRNATSNALWNVNITPFSEIDAKLTSDPQFSRIQKIMPGQEFVWTLTLSKESSKSPRGLIFFLIGYSQRDREALRKVAYGFLQLTSHQISEVADIKLETTLDTLDQQHPGKVYLIISSKMSQPIQVKDVSSEGPDFIEFDNRRGKGLIFSPYQTSVIPIDVKAKSRVQPGKHLLVFTVQFQLGDGKGTEIRNVVQTKPVEVGVFGDWVLKLLSIPSFFLIPGFLIVVTWGMLWKWGLLKWKKDTGQFVQELSEKPTSPQFWVVAITLSIFVFFGYMSYYPEVLRMYGLRDFVYVWCLSVLFIGLGGYLVISGGRRFYIIRRTPSEKDAPIDILKKLHRQKLGIFRDKVSIAKTDEVAYLLQEWKSDREMSWVGPPIRVKWEENAPDELKKEVDRQCTRSGNDASKVAGLLQKGVLLNAVTVTWKKGEQDSKEITGLREAKTIDLERKNEDCIVEVMS